MDHGSTPRPPQCADGLSRHLPARRNIAACYGIGKYGECPAIMAGPHAAHQVCAQCSGPPGHHAFTCAPSAPCSAHDRLAQMTTMR